jgi:hypothetical protein
VTDLYPTALLCHRCHASAWEAVDSKMVRERGRSVPNDLIECCFCGLMTWVAVTTRAALPVKNHIEFRFQFGRFRGLTFAEADAEKNGRRYLEHLRDTNEKLRDRIAEYLAGNALDSSAPEGEIVRLSEVSGATECPASPASSPRLFG